MPASGSNGDPDGTPTPPSELRTGRSAWDRIRDARILQLLGVYAGASFAGLQGGDILIARLGLPDWTFFGLLLVILAGIPIAILTALVQSSSRSFRLQGVFTWKNLGLAGVGSLLALGLLVGLFMSARTLGIGPVGSLVAAGVLEREEPILIADFQSPTGDSLLAGAITEAFRIDFEQSPLVRVVPPGQVRDGLIRMQRTPDSALDPELARELALREGIRAVLLGEVNTTGGSSIISVRLVAPESEEAIVSFRETASDSTSVIAAVDRLSDRLRERIGESLRSIRGGEPLEQVSTSSLLALRHYSQGTRLIDRERNFSDGIVLLEEAIAEDSTFAMAWRKLGVTLMNQGTQPERSHDALTRAYEHSDRLTDRERYLTRGTYYGNVLNDPERAILAYRRLLDLHPNDPTALNNLAVQYSDRGDPARAAEYYRRAIEIDPHSVVYYTNLVGQEVAMRDWEAAEQTAAALVRQFPDLSIGVTLGSLLASARMDHDEAEAIARRTLDLPNLSADEQVQLRAILASIALVRGQLDEAFRRFEAVLEEQARAGNSLDRDVVLAAFRSRILMMVQGDTAGAIDIVESALASAPLPPEAAFEGAHLQLAEFYLSAGRPDRAEAYLAEWDSIAAEVGALERLRSARDGTEALLRFERGDTERAIRSFRQAVDREPTRGHPSYTLASAYERAGVPDSAAHYYTRFIEAGELHRLDWDAYLLPKALEASARLYDELGETARARELYLRFANLWSEADAELQPRVRRARERAEALRDE